MFSSDVPQYCLFEQKQTHIFDVCVQKMFYLCPGLLPRVVCININLIMTNNDAVIRPTGHLFALAVVINIIRLAVLSIPCHWGTCLVLQPCICSGCTGCWSESMTQWNCRNWGTYSCKWLIITQLRHIERGCTWRANGHVVRWCNHYSRHNVVL